MNQNEVVATWDAVPAELGACLARFRDGPAPDHPEVTVIRLPPESHKHFSSYAAEMFYLARGNKKTICAIDLALISHLWQSEDEQRRVHRVSMLIVQELMAFIEELEA